MCTSADLERWQPGVDSAPVMSLYAVGPSASIFDDAWLVLPAQRPASPEMAESPTDTTVGGCTAIWGLMMRTWALAADGSSAAATRERTMRAARMERIRPPSVW